MGMLLVLLLVLVRLKSRPFLRSLLGKPNLLKKNTSLLDGHQRLIHEAMPVYSSSYLLYVKCMFYHGPHGFEIYFQRRVAGCCYILLVCLNSNDDCRSVWMIESC